ncbi:hypothetical protein C7W93_10380 [Glaciimonas sp. PCH181]|nr:hypothetical protein C7W93_10380 [Glaciimonas sp. PCH181]
MAQQRQVALNVRKQAGRRAYIAASSLKITSPRETKQKTNAVRTSDFPRSKMRTRKSFFIEPLRETLHLSALSEISVILAVL